MKAKLGDFHVGQPLVTEKNWGEEFAATNEQCGTEGFIAPEFYRVKTGPKVDVSDYEIVNQHDKTYMYMHMFCIC